MDSLTDYILWMRDVPIGANGFQTLDALVLCMLSYYDYTPMFPEGTDEICLRDCQRMIDAGSVRVEIVGKDMGYQEILEAAVDSRRFGSLRMSDYVDTLRDDPPLQFSAVTFHDESGLSFIAFRGTDSSLAGWREDFMISFTPTRAQELAKEYAERLIMPERRWLMGGHSKGGNLALYAACMLAPEQLSPLEHIYLLDGPGLCREVMDLGCIRRVKDKAVRIIPEFSVVGKLFEPDILKTRIARSSASAFMQHSLATWGVDHGRLAETAENDPVSRWINEVLDRWIGNITREERVIFIDDLFDALAGDGVKTLDDISAGGLERYDSIRQRLQNASETTRKILADLPRQAILSSFASIYGKRDAKELRLP